MDLHEVSGDHYQIGYQIGWKTAPFIQKVLASFSLSKNQKRKLNKLLAFHEEHFPYHLEELRGMAEGSRQGESFDKLLALNLIELELLLGCTNIIALGEKTTKYTYREGYLVHNEDGEPKYQGALSLVKAELKDGFSFLSLQYPGLLCGDSVTVTSNGMVFAVNYLLPQKVAKNGFSITFVARALLEARDLAEVKEILARYRPRNAAFHWFVYSRSEGEALSIEVTKDKESYRRFWAGMDFHTNHYVHFGLHQEPQWDYPSSRERLTRLYDLTDRGKLGRWSDVFEALSALLDHQGSICRHEGESINLASVVVDLATLTMFAAEGPSCCAQGKYLEARLND